MRDPLARKLAGAAGIAFVAIVIGAQFMVASSPSIDDSGATLARYFADHADSIQAQAFVGAIGGIVFVPFLIGLRNVVRRAEGETGSLASTIVVAGAAGATVGFANTAINATLAYASKHGGANPPIVKSLVDLSAMLSPNLILFPLGLVIGTVAYAALAHGALPRAVGIAGAVVTAGCLVGATGLFVDSGALRTGGGFVPALRVAILAWVVTASVAMLRAARSGEAPDREPGDGRERHREDRQVQQGQPQPA